MRASAEAAAAAAAMAGAAGQTAGAGDGRASPTGASRSSPNSPTDSRGWSASCSLSLGSIPGSCTRWLTSSLCTAPPSRVGGLGRWADVRFELIDSRGRLAVADPDQVDQVLWALLDNAVKYGGGTAVRVAVAVDAPPGASPSRSPTAAQASPMLTATASSPAMRAEAAQRTVTERGWAST